MASEDSIQPDVHAAGRPRPFTRARARPVTVWLLFLILFVQGTATAFTALGSFFGSESAVLDAVGAAVMLVVYLLAAVALVLLGFGLFQGAPAARTPAMVIELLLVIVAVSYLVQGVLVVGLLLMLPAAAALVLGYVGPTQGWLEAGRLSRRG